MIKNPYLYSYLPLITIILFSLTFGLFSVNEAIILFRKIGVYGGMHEFLSDVQMRMLLFIVFSTLYFMVFSALKLIVLNKIRQTERLFLKFNVCNIQPNIHT